MSETSLPLTHSRRAGSRGRTVSSTMPLKMRAARSRSTISPHDELGAHVEGEARDARVGRDREDIAAFEHARGGVLEGLLDLGAGESVVDHDVDFVGREANSGDDRRRPRHAAGHRPEAAWARERVLFGGVFAACAAGLGHRDRLGHCDGEGLSLTGGGRRLRRRSATRCLARLLRWPARSRRMPVASGA